MDFSFDQKATLASTPYKYSPLPLGKFFRYLILHPGGQHSPLRCSLSTSRLDIPAAPFEAISYVWGSNIRDHEILCDGFILRITANLHEVLQAFRLPHTPRNLWADSICIDQENADEKGSQVAAMGTIYSSAERVLIHISGDDEGNADSVVSLIKDVCVWIDRVIQTLGTPIPWDSFPPLKLGDAFTEDVRWHAVGELLYQPWFFRGWVSDVTHVELHILTLRQVVQEVALARDATLHWNQTKINWHQLMTTLCWLWLRGDMIYIEFDIEFPLIFVENYMRSHIHIARPFNPESRISRRLLVDCIVDSRNLGFSDSRDKIYAMLNLPFLDPESRIIERPDYASDLIDVFRSFATEHVRKTQSPEILNYVTMVHEAKLSWVPQWHSAGDVSLPLALTFPQSHLKSECRPHVKPTIIDGSILRARGVVFDVVHSTFDEIGDDCDDVPTTAMVITHLQEIWNSIESSGLPCPYEQKWLLEIFLRIVVTDKYSGTLSDWYNNLATVYLEILRSSLHPELLETHSWIKRAEPTDPKTFCTTAWAFMSNRKVILTQRGYIGLAPQATQAGDSCGIVFECRLPFILRKAGDGERFFCLGSTLIAGKRTTELDEGNNFKMNVLGSEESKDWTAWDDVVEQDIDIC
jgi:hypothetical protein